MREQPTFLGAPPVVADVVAFDLVRGGGRAPPKVAWEAHFVRFQHTFNVLALVISFLSVQDRA